MIFNNDYESTGTVKPSKYTLGLEGALMHVYENECNYNALMRAAGISELKYYQETGGDLFVNEAGAFSSFISKIKTFFKKIIEKIKAMFHKFMAVINQYSMSDKEFVKKYEKELYRRDLANMEFNGYTFKDIDYNIPFNEAMSVYRSYMNLTINSKTPPSKLNVPKCLENVINTEDGKFKADRDNMEDNIEGIRGVLLGEAKGKYSESEFRDEIKDKLYGGEKELLEIKNIRDYTAKIINTKNLIKEAEQSQTTITREIDNYIKDLDNTEKRFAKVDDAEKNDQSGNISKERSNSIVVVNTVIDIMKGASNAAVIFYGLKVQALKDQNRQAKAICVKALSYKNESASVYGESYADSDIFSGVTIR